ncbi:pseudouridine synthase [Oscillibacter sp. 1-3]|uniref:pseudouridine synthase n=1 Tax=Oscillibacter sp. 1-3 TaxID=1235797 RepID=UPI000337D623|nr:pseudouridine synthase [Oscillibacter sp. 1-3]EOS66591.1 pseudouridine synthase [Oscillibacter sp. 1-3]
MEKQRLDKIIASTGRWSRREAKELIRQGRVLVDGVPARSAEEKAEPESSEISVNGEALRYRRYTWVMLNKPAGYLSATEDGRGRTVLDLLPQDLRRQGLFPVGRLDKDTEGLLLLTNEGGLAHDLLSPRRHVDKVYYARVSGRLTEVDCAAFDAGLRLPDGLVCLPAGLEILSAGEESEAHVTLREGKFHQVKRMLAHLGKPVLYLERVRMGPLALDGALPRGAFRFLTENELEELRRFDNPTKNIKSSPKTQ